MGAETDCPLLSSALLERLIETWRTAGAGIADALIPPLSSSEIDDLLAGTGLVLPPEAKLWWETVNVSAQEQQRQIIAGRDFLRLDEALESARDRAKEEQRAIAEGGSSGAPYLWVPTWLPFVWGDGRLLAVDCRPGAGAASPVFFDGDEEITSARTCSMGEAVSWWIDGFNSGGYYLHEESGRLGIRFDSLPPDRVSTNIL